MASEQSFRSDINYRLIQKWLDKNLPRDIPMNFEVIHRRLVAVQLAPESQTSFRNLWNMGLRAGQIRNITGRRGPNGGYMSNLSPSNILPFPKASKTSNHIHSSETDYSEDLKSLCLAMIQLGQAAMQVYEKIDKKSSKRKAG